MMLCYAGGLLKDCHTNKKQPDPLVKQGSGYPIKKARDGTRTRDPDLGKVVLHQLSHSRLLHLIFFFCRAYTLKTTHCYISSSSVLFLLPKPTWLSPRPISDSQLHMLPCFHLCPIYLVVFKGSYSCDGISHLEGGFTLRCLQRLSLPDLATLPWL